MGQYNNLPAQTGVTIYKIFIAVFILFVFSGCSSAQVVEHKRPVVFLLPHQDDEMVMAGSIYDHLQQGDDVYTVMVTDGGASIMRTMINRVSRDCSMKPESGVCTSHDRLYFSQARNTEYYNAMKDLGVAEHNILFANDGGKDGTSKPFARDAELTKEKASHIITRLYAQLGDGEYNTVAALPKECLYPHPDHIALRQALSEFKDISEKHFFSDKKDPAYEVQLSTSTLEAKAHALEEYYICNPKFDRYAIGAHSVKDRLDKWRRSKVEYVIDEFVTTTTSTVTKEI
jgi:LmbE family N-acetylglucosaminyl deacetylase